MFLPATGSLSEIPLSSMIKVWLKFLTAESSQSEAETHSKEEKDVYLTHIIFV